MQQSNIDLARTNLPLKSPRGVNGANYNGPLGYEDPNIPHQMDNLAQDGLKVREPFNHGLAQKDIKSAMPMTQVYSQKENVSGSAPQQR